MWYVYILECKNKALYTGITTDVKRRFQEHLKKSAHYTSYNPPVKIVYQAPFKTRSLALKREVQIKRWPRKKKLALLRKEVVILEHVPNEKAGIILDLLKKQKIPFREIPLYKKGYSFPSLDSVRALIVMGGPMNVYEEDKFPFLKEEDHFIKRAVKARIPYLGICLGAQLLAKALGARVYKAKEPEVGWGDIHLSTAAKKDKLFKNTKSKSLRVLQWHEDTFDLPKGAAHLASSTLVRNQAFGIDGIFYGFQFHIETNRAMLEDWFKTRPDLGQILAEYDKIKGTLKRLSQTLLKNLIIA